VKIKHSLSVDDSTLYTENPTDSTKRLLTLINEFIKVTGYKINVKKSVAFLYTDEAAKKRN